MLLLSTRRFLTRAEIRSSVEPYWSATTDEAFERMFERDKDDLREMGIPLETGSNSVWDDEHGYRIRREDYALPPVSFAPDELAVLALASQAWQEATFAGAASGALRRLRSGTADAEEDLLPGVVPRVAADDPAFVPLWRAIRDRYPVTFAYRRGGLGEAQRRHLEPWGVVSWRGRWYVVGRDRDRADTRVFRLSRISGVVEPDGPLPDIRATVNVPPGVDLRAEVAGMVPDQLARRARLRVRRDAGRFLRQRAVAIEPDPHRPGDWDVVTVSYIEEERLADEVSRFGADVVVLEPVEVRAAVVRRLHAVLSEPVEVGAR
jgi:proteasome accessory factor B